MRHSKSSPQRRHAAPCSSIAMGTRINPDRLSLPAQPYGGYYSPTPSALSIAKSEYPANYISIGPLAALTLNDAKASHFRPIGAKCGGSKKFGFNRPKVEAWSLRS